MTIIIETVFDSSNILRRTSVYSEIIAQRISMCVRRKKKQQQHQCIDNDVTLFRALICLVVTGVSFLFVSLILLVSQSFLSIMIFFSQLSQSPRSSIIMFVVFNFGFCSNTRHKTKNIVITGDVFLLIVNGIDGVCLCVCVYVCLKSIHCSILHMDIPIFWSNFFL